MSQDASAANKADNDNDSKAFARPSSWKDLPPYHANFGPFLERGQSSLSSSSGVGSPPIAATAAARAQDQGEQKATTSTATHYKASCYCGRVRYRVRGEPLSAKLCHCRGCQLFHGAPFEWVAIFQKENIKFDDPSALQWLYFYNSELDTGWTADQADERVLPVKVTCAHCRTPIADEGRHMWLAYCTLFGFTVQGGGIPPGFRHSCHLFYSQRCIDLHCLPENEAEVKKWVGHRNKSPEWTEESDSR